jgi:hypothetical protein
LPQILSAKLANPARFAAISILSRLGERRVKRQARQVAACIGRAKGAKLTIW